MATKTVVLSDLSGVELDDSTHARVTVKHPDMNFPVSLDISAQEAAQLVNTTLRLVEFTINEPGKPQRTALVETKQLDRLFKGVNFDDVLASAPKATVKSAGAAPARKRSSGSASGERVDYSAPENAGQLHRGRVTDAEKEWVKANQDKASANRERQTGKPIDWSDPSERKRYGLD